MKLNKTMTEVMKECYEFINSFTKDESSAIKSAMITELFRAHIFPKGAGVNVMEVMEHNDEYMDGDTFWGEPFIPSKKRKATEEFENRKEKIRYEENEYWVVFEDDSIFGLLDDFKNINNTDIIYKFSDEKKYMVVNDLEEADGGYVAYDVLAIERKERSITKLLKVLDTALDNKNISKQEYLQKINEVFEYTKAKVQVKNGNKEVAYVSMSFALDDDIVYGWDVVNKKSNNNIVMEKGHVIFCECNNTKKTFSVLDVDAIDIDKNNTQHIYYLKKK